MRALLARIARWRVGLGWYAVAVGTVPALTLVILFLLSRIVSPTLKPGWMPIGLVFGALAGFFEEIGWTGFALPRLQKKYGGLAAGLLLGVLWGLWHMAADYSGNIYNMGEAWFLNFFIYWIVPLTAYRILIAWVYQNTQSLLLAQIIHACYTGGLGALTAPLSLEMNKKLPLPRSGGVE